MTTMLTDQRLEEFLFVSEGGNRKAYDDKQPWLDLKPGDEIKGTLTYGPGFTTRPDGSPVQIGDTMTDQEAYDRLRQYIRDEIEPVLEDLIHVPIAVSMANALGSLVFNFGGAEVYKWRLWGRINSGEPPLKIINEWVTGTFFSGGEPMLGLWRRRFKELALAFGQDWRAGENVDWEDKPDDFLRVLGWDGSMPKPEPIVHENLFEPEKPGMSDPTPETPMTMDDRQFLSARAAGYEDSYDEFMGHRTIVAAKNAIKAPNLDTKRAPKPMEDSKTFSGLSKKESGKEAIQWSTVLGGTAGTVGVVKGLTQNTADTVEAAKPLFIGFNINHLIIVGLGLGLFLLGVGIFRMIRGHYMAKDGRAEGVQPKI